MSDVFSLLEKQKLKISKSGLWFHQGKKLTDGEIAQMVWFFEEYGMSQAEVQRITKRDYKTVQKYHKLWESGEIEELFLTKHKNNNSGNFTSGEKIDFLKELATSCPGMTLQGMKLRFQQFFEENISTSMIYYLLKKYLNKSFKKIVPIEWARTQKRVITLHD